MRIAVFGLGYVGSVTVACLADLGHSVIGVDVQASKVHAIETGRSPINEPGLSSMLNRLVRSGVVQATRSADEAVNRSDIGVICVGTPSGRDGRIDPSHVRDVIRDIASALQRRGNRTYQVVNRSTCLPEVHQELKSVVAETTDFGVEYYVHPEFLREGTAIADFMAPPIIVFGGSWHGEPSLGKQLYPGFDQQSFYLSLEEATLVKYASNILHAVKITFSNEIGMLSNMYDVDARRVMEVVCEDQTLNISKRYLRPGMAFGGSCLPKDVRAVLHRVGSWDSDLPMISSVMKSNELQKEALASDILSENHRSVAILGLAFKRGTDDLRSSPLVDLAGRLAKAGIHVSVWDPNVQVENLVEANARYLETNLPDAGTMLRSDIAEAVSGVDVVIIGQEIDRETWARVELTSAQEVYDLVGVLTPDLVPGRYRGLYWSG